MVGTISGIEFRVPGYIPVLQPPHFQEPPGFSVILDPIHLVIFMECQSTDNLRHDYYLTYLLHGAQGVCLISAQRQATRPTHIFIINGFNVRLALDLLKLLRNHYMRFTVKLPGLAPLLRGRVSVPDICPNQILTKCFV